MAAALRLWGLQFGFPHVLAHPDEVRVVHTGVEFLGGRLDPGFFNYPSLYLYALGVLDAGYCAASVAFGRFSSMQACAASWPAQWEPFFLLARTLSALAGTAAVILVWRLGVRLFGDPAGLAGAALLAVAFLHVRDSHFGVTDVAMTTLLLAALLLLVRAHDAPSTGAFAVAGLVAGFATSTKYSAGVLAAVAVASQIVAWNERRGVAAVDWRLPVVAAAMIAGFLAGTPYALLARERFLADVSGEAAHLAAGHGVALDVGWRHHFLVTLWHGVTWPLLFAGILGMGLMAWRQPRRAALLLAFPLAYYAVAGRGQTVFARYMIPIVPFVCLAAGYAAVAGGRRVGRSQAAVAAWSCVLVALLAAAPLVKSIQLDRLLARTDTRVLASRWILQNLPAGATVHLSGSAWGRPEVAPRGSANPFVLASYDETRDLFRAEGADLKKGPDFIVLQESALVMYSHVPAGLRAWLARYDLRQRFPAASDRESRVYDQQDAFYLPLANFTRVVRPGPNLFIYARRSERTAEAVPSNPQ